LKLHAQPAARNDPFFPQLVNYGFGLVRADRKGDAYGAAGQGKYDGVDTNNIAREVERRPTRIALVYGRIDLNEILIVGRTSDFATSRPRADTMPAVTVPRSPYGFPIVMIQSPTFGDLSANST